MSEQMSFIKIKNDRGPKLDPRGSPKIVIFLVPMPVNN